MKCAASLRTSSSGVAVRCLLFRQRTQASVARAVVIQRKKTACHKVNSDAVCGYTANADVNGARNILAAGTPFLPVEDVNKQVELTPRHGFDITYRARYRVP